MYCSKCGKEIAGDDEFCGYCGAPVKAAANATPPPVGLPMGPSAQPLPYAPPPKKSALPWVLGIMGVAAVVALVLVLVLVVSNSDDNKADTSGSEQVVKDFFRSWEKQDPSLLLATMEPSFRKELEDALGKDYKQLIEDYVFSSFPDDLKVNIRKMDTRIDGDEATVKITEGEMIYTNEYGDEVTEEASESDISAIELVRIDGKWYLAGDFLKGMGFDPEDLVDLDTGDTGDIVTDSEVSDVEEAMLGYAYANSAEGLQLAIISIDVNGDEAVGIARCYNQELEDPFVVMKKGSGVWKGADFGTGIELPSWYETEMADLKKAILDNFSSGGFNDYEITSLYVWGDEAVGTAVSPTNSIMKSLTVIIKKGSGGWKVMSFGTDPELPDWYWTGS